MGCQPEFRHAWLGVRLPGRVERGCDTHIRHLSGFQHLFKVPMMDTTIDGLASETVGRIDIDSTVSKNSANRQKDLETERLTRTSSGGVVRHGKTTPSFNTQACRSECLDRRLGQHTIVTKLGTVVLYPTPCAKNPHDKSRNTQQRPWTFSTKTTEVIAQGDAYNVGNGTRQQNANSRSRQVAPCKRQVSWHKKTGDEQGTKTRRIHAQ